jgi:excisionase family DNA binding protein
MHFKERQSESPRNLDAVSLRFDIAEAAAILRMSRAQLYKRIKSGALRPQKDGTRTYITRDELERYVKSCNDNFIAE